MVEFGHHTQNDRWAIELVFPGLRGGYFVEAGACGGYTGSASYVLEREFGWTGICVEPQDDYYEILCRLRSCRTDPRCLSDRTGDTVEFLRYPDDPPRSGIRALNNNAAWAAKREAIGETSTKETVTLHDLLEHHRAPRTIHYLCLDVEGAEFSILEPFDFDGERQILALSVEGTRCNALLEARGYSRVKNPFASREIDYYFVHASLSAQLQHLLV